MHRTESVRSLSSRVSHVCPEEICFYFLSFSSIHSHSCRFYFSVLLCSVLCADLIVKTCTYVHSTRRGKMCIVQWSVASLKHLFLCTDTNASDMPDSHLYSSRCMGSYAFLFISLRASTHKTEQNDALFVYEPNGWQEERFSSHTTHTGDCWWAINNTIFFEIEKWIVALIML